jgi:hypothetical protein
LDVADVLVARIDGATGGARVAVLVKGDVAIGVDLTRGRFDDVDPAAQTATLILPAPAPSRPRVDHERTRLFAMTQHGLWAITPGTEGYTAVANKALAEAQALVTAANGADADERSRRQAEVLLVTFCRSLGWTIHVRWSDRAPA